jgi:hypothetical protein
MDIESFRECSTLLETFIRDIGLSRWDGTTTQRCSGELLFNAVSQQQAIESVISSSEQAIILKLGSRVTACDGFTGVTSHGVACGLLARIVDDYGPSIRNLIGDPLHWPAWGTIPKTARGTLSSWELKLNPRPPDWPTLADSVYTERILFLDQMEMQEPKESQTKTGEEPDNATLFRMEIHSQSKTVSRLDMLGIERTCAIKNVEQWDVFMLAVKHGGTLSKAQIQHLLPNKVERNNTTCRLRERLQEIQLTFNSVPGYYILKEFFE